MDKPKKPWRVGDGTPGPGRPKGSRDKRNRFTGLANDGDPLDGDELLRALFSVVRDPNATREEVMKAAIGALPYRKQRLASLEVTGGENGSPVRIRVIRDEPKPPEPGK